jgi:2-polyprenyl-3-methyl-5-hydroxy-6-metoxy-1,4-benzoquinol methylase
MTSPQQNAHKTAIYRKNPSVSARYVIEKILPVLKFKSILDWGCGRGRDVEYFKEQGLKCEGYDPYYSPDVPAGTFDFATCTYVLNVIDNVSERIQCLNDVHMKLKCGGCALITIRPATEIVNRAFNYDWSNGLFSNKRRKKEWNICSDGYITTRGTFQSLMTMPVLIKLVEKCQFKAVHKIDNSKTVMVLVEKI